jgi:prepilin-type N-terminal cleavage/methylation domain-containing protein
MMTNHLKQHNHQVGFTLVELLVTLVVSAIVIAGTISGYTYFSQQYQVLNQRIAIDRDVLAVMDLIQTDIGKAGFKAYATDNPAMTKADLFVGVSGGGPSASMWFLYDDYKDDGTLYRAGVNYYIEKYTSTITGTERNILKRDLRQCTAPATGCLEATSTSLYASADGRGEPILYKVTKFEVQGLNAKTGCAD